MKLKELLARRSTTYSMNPQFMSDEYMNRRRSFGRGGAGNIRSREEAVLPHPLSIPPNIHESLACNHPGSLSASASESDTDGYISNSNSENDTQHSQRISSPNHHDFHYRYHYRHYRPHHFLTSDTTTNNHDHEQQQQDPEEERRRRRSSMWSSMSISSSTGTHQSALSSSRLLNGMSNGVRQVLSGGSCGSSGSGHGHGQARRKGSLGVGGGKERA